MGKYPRGRMPVGDALEEIAREGKNAGLDMRVRERTATRVDKGVEHERYVEVEYVGEASLLNDPVVQFKLATAGQKNGFNAHQSAVIRASSRIRASRFPGKVREVLSRHGFTRDYRWSEKNKWIQRMTIQDAERLKSAPGGHQFVVLGQEEPRSSLILPQNSIRISDDRDLRRVVGYIHDPRKPSLRNG